jgi:hypothetical protein
MNTLITIMWWLTLPLRAVFAISLLPIIALLFPSALKDDIPEMWRELVTRRY